MPTVLESPTKSVSFKLTGVGSLLGLGAFVSAGFVGAGFVSTGFVGLGVAIGSTVCTGVDVGSGLGAISGSSWWEQNAKISTAAVTIIKIARVIILDFFMVTSSESEI